MVALGAKPADVAARLGISVGELRKLRSINSDKNSSETAPVPPTPAEPAPASYTGDEPVSVSA